ncbi:MAG: radical SAM protein [Candidatus Delongbacteria bacterium]|nr:radical SAM protein [Candidatus Delongbacteria bacterium]MBN2834586.1 radical SAM protein [Candidatus Delongbacteria bacterium]
MTGYIFDIKKFAVHDGPGVRTTVFFMGCPLRCSWCHNSESLRSVRGVSEEFSTVEMISSKRINGAKIDIDTLVSLLLKDRIIFEESGGGVTLSGGEATSQSDFIIELIKRLKKEDINISLDTCGYCDSESFSIIVQNVDVILFDIKVLCDDLHKKYTGKSNDVILENLKIAENSGSRVIIRHPVIDEVNGNMEHFRKVIDLMKHHNLNEIDILPYHRLGEAKWKDNLESHRFSRPSEELLQEMKNHAEINGMKVSIGG